MNIGDPIEKNKNASPERKRFKDRDDCRRKVRAAMLTIYHNLTEAEIEVIISSHEGYLITGEFDKYTALVDEDCKIERFKKETA